MANTLSSIKDNKVAIGLLNPFKTPFKIKAKTKLGTFSPLSSSDILQNLDDPETLSKSQNNLQVYHISQTNTPSDTAQNFSSTKSKHHHNLEFSEARECLKETIDLCKSDLKEEQKEQLFDLLANHREALSLKDKLGNCTHIDHEIPLKPGTRPYRYSMLNDEACKHVSAVLEKDVIELSTYSWFSPICIVSKPRSNPKAPVETRMTINYRKLNDKILPYVHPLPRLDATIDRIGTQKPLYFSTIDFLSGFFQVNLDQKSRPYTSFSFKGGNYQFSKFVQSLKNAPAFFSRLM